MKFAHTMIRVKDIEKSLRFYTELIGLKHVKTMELKDATLYFVADEDNFCQIELTHNHKLPEEGYHQGNYFGHLAFATEDMNNFSERLRAFGLEYTRPPFNIKETGPRIAFLNDPDGFTIEIIQRN
jgi:lactoylglutathione lyase